MNKTHRCKTLLDEGADSKKQEKRVAKRFRGSVTPASGAMAKWKGDVNTELFLVECKVTGHGSRSLKYDELEKIENEANALGKIPLLVVGLYDGTKEYVVMRREDFEGMMPEGGI